MLGGKKLSCCRLIAPNFEGTKFTVPSHLWLSFWRTELMSLGDRTVGVYFEFEWPISIFQSPEDKLQVSVSYWGKSIASGSGG